MANFTWDEFDNKFGDNGSGGNFKKWEQDPNEIFLKETTQLRLIEGAYAYDEHYLPNLQPGAQPRGLSFRCPGSDTCAACLAGEKPRTKFLWLAFQRTVHGDGSYTVRPGYVRLTITMMQGINSVRKTPGFGEDLRKYDVIVNVIKGKKTSYTVNGIPSNVYPKLEEAEKSVVLEKIKAINTDSLVGPTPKDEVDRIMKTLNYDTGTVATVVQKLDNIQQPQQTAPQPSAAATATDDDFLSLDTTSEGTPSEIEL